MPSAVYHEARVFITGDTEEDRFLPEGPRPIVLEGRDALLWVNIQTAPDATAGALHLRFWDTAERRVWPLPGRPGCVFPTNRPGVVLIGMGKEVGLYDLARREWQPLATIADPNPRTIINDGEVAPGGRAVVFGTKDTHFADPIAGLYLFTVGDNVVSLLAGEQVCSNGKVLARDGSDLVLFDIDTPTRRVVRYRLDVAARIATLEAVAVEVLEFPGFPDGMRDAGEGTAIIAFYNPDPVKDGRAARFDLASGKAVEHWSIPTSPRVTCPCLVQRPDGVKLVLTTATEGMPATLRESATEAGNLFLAETDLVACPPPGLVQLD